MTTDHLLALAGFALVTSITPGPNNFMLMASGANFGVRRTIPHALGVSLGFVFMLVLMGLGLMALFDLWPATKTALKALCAVFLVYLAWKFATAAPRDPEAPNRARPMTFIQASAFQWVNPKAVMMAISAVSLYAPDRSLGALLMVGLVFGLVNQVSVSTWMVAGSQMRRLLSTPTRMRAFNAACGLALLATLIPILTAA